MPLDAGGGGGAPTRRARRRKPLYVRLKINNPQTSRGTTYRWVRKGSDSYHALLHPKNRPSGYTAKVVGRRRSAYKPGSLGWSREGDFRSPDARDAGSKDPIRRPGGGGAPAVWARRARNGNARAAKSLQKWLRSQGYRVTVDGKWGPQTAAAYAKSRGGNTGGSKKGTAAGNPRNRFNKSPLANKPGGRKKKGGRGGGKGGGFGAAVGGVQKSLGGKGQVGQKLNADQYANALAGMQFDPQIRDLKTLIARLGPQNTQAINDIDSWFGNATQLNQQAGQRTGQIYQDVAGQQDAAIANMMQALGGAGNEANQALAATNLRDTGYQRALGGIEQQYHADMNPIIASAQASAKQREQRLNLQQMQDYQLQLADLMGQRGQAEAAANFEARKYNNELAQAWFQNRLASVNAALGAQAAGLDMAVQRERIASSRAQRAAAKKAGGGAGKFVGWNRLNPVERSQLLTTAVYKPDGSRRPLGEAQNYLVSMGYAAGSRGKAIPGRTNTKILAALKTFYR